VPAIAETLPGFDASGWNGIVVPAGTPASVISRLNSAFNEVLQSAEMATKYRNEGLIPDPQSPEAFATMIANETKRVAALVKKAGITIN